MVLPGQRSTNLDDLDLFVPEANLLSMLSSEQCRAARALLDWTQEELAERAGVSRSTVRGFENGQHEPHRASSGRWKSVTLFTIGVTQNRWHT
jgi:DNA-binding Xre family transcriptional regulator